MITKPTVATLAVQMDQHRKEFEASQTGAVEARRELGRKIDDVAICVRKGMSTVHTRIDGIISEEKKKEQLFYQTTLKWAFATFGSVTVFLLGVIGYLLISGTPWAGPAP